MKTKPIIFLILLILFFGVVFYYFPEISSMVEFSNIKKHQGEWANFYRLYPIEVISVYFLLNAFIATLPLPGISMISFVGGVLFGFYHAVIISSLATAVGNLGGFLMSRYFLQDWVRTRYASQIKSYGENWENKAAMTLFTMRLFVFIPSFVANMIMGISSLKAWTFFWVSWVGRFPVIIVYAFGGEKISEINSFREILSPPLVIAFISLAFTPWILKFVLKVFRIKHAS